MDFVIQEARICRGSPTNGSENAFRVLTQNGLCEMFSARKTVCTTPAGQKSEPYPGNMKYLGEVMALNRELYRNTYDALSSHRFPITIGGDHSCAIGTIAGSAEYYGKDDLSVIYIDGHADINTERSTVTGYIHGMPLASSLGLCADCLTVGKEKQKIKGENVYIIGARSVDENEYPIIRDNGVHLYTADEIRRRGMESVMNEVCSRLGTKKVHISFDVDFLDKDVFPATGYLMENGLAVPDAACALKKMISTGKVVSFDCVEYNPCLDTDGKCMAILFELLRNIKE